MTKKSAKMPPKGMPPKGMKKEMEKMPMHKEMHKGKK